jgi:hypothetical protein
MTNEKDGLPLLQLINERLEEMDKNNFRCLFAGIKVVAFLLAILILLNAKGLHRFAQLECKCDETVKPKKNRLIIYPLGRFR